VDPWADLYPVDSADREESVQKDVAADADILTPRPGRRRGYLTESRTAATLNPHVTLHPTIGIIGGKGYCVTWPN
jgi:hypothetical protein